MHRTLSAELARERIRAASDAHRIGQLSWQVAERDRHLVELDGALAESDPELDVMLT